MQPLYWILKDKCNLNKYIISILILLLLTVPTGLFGQSLGILTFPLTIDSEPSGEIDVSVDDVDGLLIPLQQLQEKLDNIISEEVLSTLQSLPPWVSSEELQTKGIGLLIDETNLSVSISLNPKQKVIRTISLISNALQISGYILEPADYSFNINFSAHQALNLQTQLENLFQSSPFALTINPNIQFKSWNLSSSMRLQSNTDSIYTFDSILLQNNFQNLGIKLAAGNISTDPIRFQENPVSIGLIVSNQTDQSSAAYRSAYNYSLYLEEKSQVKIYVNNSLKKTYQLPSGRYVFEDFSLAQGVNDVSLEIAPESGEERLEKLQFGHDYSTLPKSKTQFSYGIGYESWKINWAKLPIIFGKQRLGITDNLTAGIGFQIADSYQFTGIDTIWSTTFGTFSVSSAISNSKSIGLGSALYAGYTYSHKDYPQVGISGTYYSDLFVTYGSTELISTKPLFLLTASAGHTFLGLLGISGSVSMETNRNSLELNFSGNLKASAKISKSLSITASTSVNDKSGILNWYGSIQLTYHPNNNATITTNSNIEDGETGITYHLSPENWNGNGSISASVAGFSPDDLIPDNISASGYYKTQIFDLSLSQQVILGATFSDPIIFSTAITAATALSYADGLLGVSRPITDSFVIVGPKYLTNGLTLGIRTSEQTVNSSNNIFGTVVLPNISSNNYNKIQVEIIDFPSGFDPGQSSATFKPTRGQGAAFKIGTEAVVYAKGRLLQSDSLPAAFLLGTVTYLDDTLSEPQNIFTDQQGVFFIYNLKPGQYEITVEVAGWDKYILDIKHGMSGLLDLGDFYLLKNSEPLIKTESLIDTYSGSTVIISEDSTVNLEDDQEIISVIPMQSELMPAQSMPKDVVGRLLYEDQSGVAFCNGGIVKVNDDSFESLFFTTDIDGEFYLNSLAPGEYELTFFYLNELLFPLRIPDNSDRAQHVEEFIIPNAFAVQPEKEPENPESRFVETSESPVGILPETRNVEIPVLADTLSILISPAVNAGIISGQVTDAEGAPIPFLNGCIVDLQFYNTIDSPVFFSTDINGFFSIPEVLPGEYNLQLFYYKIQEYNLMVPLQTSIPGMINITLDDMFTI
ncbi:MAG: hypothetical protein HQ557_10125 [Bacteroidetes bacterium]|nr:hypothetical protein [Bacteroidota bacterium]